MNALFFVYLWVVFRQDNPWLWFIVPVVILVAISILIEIAKAFRTRDALEIFLRRASRGAAYVLIPIITVFYLHSPGEIFDYAASGGDWVGIILLAVIGYGCFQFWFASRWLRGASHPWLAARALIKIIAGCLLYWYCNFSLTPYSPFWAFCLWAFIVLMSWWLVITGVVRFFLMIDLSGGQTIHGPYGPDDDDPYGKSGLSKD